MIRYLLIVALAATGAACGDGDRVRPPSPASPAPGAGQVHYAVPAGPPRVASGQRNPDGTPATVACSSCHTQRTPNPATRDGAALTQFHQGLTMAHGNLTCLSCHDGRDYDGLRLVDETPVSFPEVMTLCRQCHGPQFRDYQHGAHGGMTGYWDLTKGPRTRNACTNCHDPHAPAFQAMLPAPGPIDRFAEPTPHDDGDH